jgi:hypothetical protein
LIMLIFYIDEFGDDSLLSAPGDPKALKAGVSPWFVLSAIGVRDSSRERLAQAIVEAKEKAFGGYDELRPWGDSEIKGRHLVRCSRRLTSGKSLSGPAAYSTLNVAGLEALIAELASIFGRFRPVIFSVAVDKHALLQRKQSLQRPVLGIAYTYLLQRVALTVDRIYSGEPAILVADQQTSHERFFRSGGMHQVRDEMTNPLPVQPRFDLVLDKPLWIDTDLSRWDREILQLADIVAYSTGRCVLQGSEPEESPYLWASVRGHMALGWSSGSVLGGGFAIHPKPENFPIA